MDCPGKVSTYREIKIRFLFQILYFYTNTRMLSAATQHKILPTCLFYFTFNQGAS